MMQSEKISIEYYLFDNANELDLQQSKALNAAADAFANSYAPYSGYKVGAAILLEDGFIISGCNQENASYPCGICAERAALFTYGNLIKPARILKLAISTQKQSEQLPYPPAPCGLCRQVMVEFEQNNLQEIELILGHPNRNIVIFQSLNSLLPMHFHTGHLLNKL